MRDITNGVHFAYALAGRLDRERLRSEPQREEQRYRLRAECFDAGTDDDDNQDVVKPRDVQFDPAGDLNVLNASDVSVYAPGSDTPLRKVQNKLTFTLAMTFDTAGDLFVLNQNDKKKETSIVEFAAGSTKVLRTFDGPQFAYADRLVMGPDGYLYVAADISVIVVDPATGSTIRTITNGVDAAHVIAFDPTGNLYVANEGGSGGPISVYAPEASTPSYQIDLYDVFGQALLFDRKHNLYVVSPGGILEFAPGKTNPKRTIGQGTEYPWAAAFGP